MKNDWALIEAPIPNAPEGKYISQIPSPNNLLMLGSALHEQGIADMRFYNFLKDRDPGTVHANNIVYNLGEATCMDYLYNYAIKYLHKLVNANINSKIYLIGYHAWLHKNESWSKYPNVVLTTPFNFENEISGASGEEWHNLWELNDWEWMENNVCSVTKGVRCTIRASRGCPHNCAMCPVRQLYGRKIRRNSIDWVIKELDELYHKYGIRQVGFLDDNLMCDRKWGKELLHRMISHDYKGASFTFEEGLDVPTALDEELIALLKQARFTHIKLGIESFNPETLKLINKPYKNPEHGISAIKLLQKYKLSPVCFICIGFPTDTEESLKETVKILTDLKVKLRVQILWNYPGVEFSGNKLPYETLKKIQCDAMYGTNSVAWRHKK